MKDSLPPYRPASRNYNEQRLRKLNAASMRAEGKYVLYWMQLFRRLDHNHALNYAAACAREMKKPLVIYEGLKLTYPWANDRIHRFALDGMRDNQRRAAQLGLNYWPFVEMPAESGRGLLRRLAADAAVVVTDDYPGFIVPEQSSALASKVDVSVIAVDGNSIVPLSRLGAPVSAAAHLRPRIHKAFAEAWENRAGRSPLRMPKTAAIAAPFESVDFSDLDQFLAQLPIDHSVRPVEAMPGGSSAAKKRLQEFIRTRLKGYADRRSQPAPPDEGHASGLSPYLHFGHISIEEVAAEVLESRGDWSPKELQASARGKREGFFCDDADINSFLDEAITWRDVGYHWHCTRREDTASLARALPSWALSTLNQHRDDRREHEYALEEWETGATHDSLWNAAQRELVATGTIHNYLRMLWGKKIIEWSRSPEEAYQTMVHLNNKYALDGRDPNSYTGILWCFGLFDRPWAPERAVFGRVRYMSSENTARKFKVGRYLEYVAELSKPTGHRPWA